MRTLLAGDPATEAARWRDRHPSHGYRAGRENQPAEPRNARAALKTAPKEGIMTRAWGCASGKVNAWGAAVMGITFVAGEVRGPTGKSHTVNFLVDSGATCSLLPKAVWPRLELVPKRELSFPLADGTTIKRQVSEALVTFAQGDGHTPVILGEENDEALLGVVTLEILGLVFNPFSRTLSPMRMLLA
jgi:clan AA aspartic protease